MSKLRGVPPSQIIKRPKMFWFGEPGTWKTSVAMQFPKVYLIDTEHGAENEQYVQALEKVGGHHWHTTNLDEIIEEVRALQAEAHPFRSLVIDPITVPYNDACDRAARELADEKKGLDGTEFGRHKNRADRKMRTLFNLLLSLDMNVILTSHLKGKWEKVGDKIEQTGTTYDSWNKLEYLFDLMLEAQKRGKERKAVVRKSRVGAFPEGDVFDFTYAEMARRYGADVLERRAEPVPIASDEQIERLRYLIETVKLDPEIVEKWLDKANAEKLEELSAATATKCIEHLESKVLGSKPTPEAVS